jgi:hypothetical protein
MRAKAKTRGGDKTITFDSIREWLLPFGNIYVPLQEALRGHEGSLTQREVDRLLRIGAAYGAAYKKLSDGRRMMGLEKGWWRNSPEYSSASRNLQKETIGHVLNELRKTCRWSYKKLSEETGINLRLVFRHVKGTIPRPDHIEAYERAFSAKLNRAISIT